MYPEGNWLGHFVVVPVFGQGKSPRGAWVRGVWWALRGRGVQAVPWDPGGSGGGLDEGGEGVLAGAGGGGDVGADGREVLGAVHRAQGSGDLDA